MTDRGQDSTCEQCGGPTRPDEVALTLWASIGLVVVEDVSAQVCANCGEQYYDEATQGQLLSLASSGFSKREVVRTIEVPVYSLRPEAAAEDIAERQTA